MATAIAVSLSPSVPLFKYLETYALENDIAPATAEQYTIAVRLFERFAPGVGLEDLTDELVNRWLVWLEEGRGKRTVHNYRRTILTLWYHAHQACRTGCGPQRVKKLKMPQVIPRCWSPEQVIMLLAAADAQRGQFRKSFMPRRLWWRAFILVSWNTALRLGDVLNLKKGDVQGDGSISLVQAKTGHVHRCQLRPETRTALARVGHTRRTLLPLWGTRATFYVSFRRLAALAGLDGTSKWLRRSSATAVEAIQPGGAMAHLGHRTPGLAYKHYIDPTKLSFNRPLPPPIAPDINGQADTP